MGYLFYRRRLFVKYILHKRIAFYIKIRLFFTKCTRLLGFTKRRYQRNQQTDRLYPHWRVLTKGTRNGKEIPISQRLHVPSVGTTTVRNTKKYLVPFYCSCSIQTVCKETQQLTCCKVTVKKYLSCLNIISMFLTKNQSYIL